MQWKFKFKKSLFELCGAIARISSLLLYLPSHPPAHTHHTLANNVIGRNH